MKSIRIIIPAVLSVLLTGCSIFGKYSGKAEVPDKLYGNEVEVNAKDTSIADIPWREFFRDSTLRNLIDTALSRNTDLAVARLKVQEAEAALLGSKLGFLPSLAVSPSLSYSNNLSYQVPLSLSWDNQGLGSLINRKREAQARAAQSLDLEKGVQSRLIASVADAYSQLLLLDRQYQIIDSTETVWETVLQTQKALMENGKCYSTSVSQMESSLIDVRIRKADIRNEITNVEHSLCLLLNRTPGEISRGGWVEEYTLPEKLKTGIPADILKKRPDVRAAEKSVEAAYYVSRQALGAMFPSLSLSGMLGWTTQGISIKDPAQFIMNALASLTQPIFARGKLAANYKISNLQQQEAARLYSQAILSAGNEVNKNLRECQLAEEKGLLYKIQVAILEESYAATRELMRNGKASYIEVLVAQDNLLNAQLSEAANIYSGVISLISLYISLGGGAD